MYHSSIKLDSPIEIINIVPYNPLISQCQIKVCYVSDEPNRNKSIITKETATKIAASLPGSPIVGCYNENTKDFEGHEKIFEIKDGQLKLKDNTQPYGFVDLGAKVWFQKFLDDNSIEREYLMTEGWLWTSQYPECQRIIDKGNNQSMELDEKIIDAFWSKDQNGAREFFIINEAIISKLCILGEEVEPCFEGASVTAPIIEFSYNDNFKEKLLSMMTELKDLLKEGGNRVFTKYSVEIGDNSVWTTLFNFGVDNGYTIDSVCEEDGQKFVIYKTNESQYSRINFSLTEEDVCVLAEETVALEEYTPSEEPQFTEEAIEAYKNSIISDNNEQSEEIETEVIVAETITYTLEEIPEYVELVSKYSTLEEQFNTLSAASTALTEQYEAAIAEKTALETEVASLREFKLGIDKKQKEAMIASFYMLSDEDKKDVIDNIDSYSLDDIEAKLSIICVRNKVNFGLDNGTEETRGPIVFNLDDDYSDASTPAWVKAALEVAKEMN